MSNPALAEIDTAVIDDLVDANHILYQQGVVDGFGHVSARHPANPNHFLIARSMAPALVTADDIMEIDLDSRPVAPNAPPSYLERFIHGEIYRSRPDVMAVAHRRGRARVRNSRHRGDEQRHAGKDAAAR